MGHWRECHDMGSGQRGRRCRGTGCNSQHTPRDHTPLRLRTVRSNAHHCHLHTGNILRPPGCLDLGLPLLVPVPVMELLPGQNGLLPPRPLLLLPLLLAPVVVLLLVV